MVALLVFARRVPTPPPYISPVRQRPDSSLDVYSVKFCFLSFYWEHCRKGAAPTMDHCLLSLRSGTTTKDVQLAVAGSFSCGLRVAFF